MKLQNLAHALEGEQLMHYPPFRSAAEGLHLYLRHLALVEVERGLFPHTEAPLTTQTCFADRSPIQLLQTDFETLAERIESRLLAPLQAMMPLYDEWAYQYLDDGLPELQPYPMGPCFSWEDVDLNHCEPGACGDKSFVLFWLFHHNENPDTAEAAWRALCAGYGFGRSPDERKLNPTEFPDTPIPRRKLGVLPGRFHFDAGLFLESLFEAGMLEFFTLLLVALGETNNPYLDYNPYEDGSQPWEVSISVENIRWLHQTCLEAEAILQVHTQALDRLEREPETFSKLITLLEQACLPEAE